MANTINDDNVQHGIDDDPHNDSKKGMELGALGGGTVGAIAGLAVGPIGAIIGAIVGGAAGSLAAGAAVEAVDAIDNDNTITGIGIGGAVPFIENRDPADESLRVPSNEVPGIQTGGVATAVADTRDSTEKTAVTGDRADDKISGRIRGNGPMARASGSMGHIITDG